MQPPTLVNYAYTNPGSSTSLVVAPDSSVTVGNWMIMVLATLNNTTITTPPSGWTQVEGLTVAGTLATVIWAKQYAAGDTSYSVTLSGNNNTSSLLLFWMTGADDVSTWTVGTNMNRANIVPVTTFNNVAPGVTPTRPNSLVLTISTERTIATESDIANIINSREWFFGVQNGTQYETTMIGYLTQPSLAKTNDVTIVYPNTQALNGSALQIAIPPAINLITLPAIQTASNAALFMVGNGAVTNGSTPSLSGSSLRVAPSAASVYPYIYGQTPSQWAPVTSGNQYTAVASLLTTTNTFQFHAILLWYDATSTFLSSSAGSATSITTASWGQCSVTANAPTGAAYATVQVQADNALGTSDLFYIDNYGIFAGTGTSWNMSANIFPTFMIGA